MRTLAVDLGEKRVGLALSDEDGSFATPLQVLQRTGDRALISDLARLVKLHEVGTIVVGLPLHMDGREGPEAARARTFAERLSEKTKRPVELWDERWSTIAAERALREGGGRRRGPVDHVAAALLLQGYLDAQSGPTRSEPEEG